MGDIHHKEKLEYIRYTHTEHKQCARVSSHVTKRRSDWPELFGMASQGISPKIPDHLFHGHFVSGNGGLGTRLRMTKGFASQSVGKIRVHKVHIH